MKPCTKFEPMRLIRRAEPFDHADWIFELKLDGFRALAYLENGEARLVSRNGNTFSSFRDLAAEVAADFRGSDAVLDGENDTRRPLWVKIKNPAYTQAEGREELFEELRT